jgi:apolipoprotein D and lipocalin family protein
MKINVMQRFKLTLILLIMTSLFTGCRSQPPETVEFVDLEKYSGLWYEIAAFPTRFEKGCSNTTAEYQLSPKGYVIVINRCIRESKRTEIKGKAFVVPNSGNARLKVQFFWPFRGDYWIFELADNYSWAVVGSPKRNYLWILARSPEMNEQLYNEVAGRIAEKGFDISRLQKTYHENK